MNVYKIDTGATYLVAAPNMMSAVVVAWRAWAGCDDREAIEDSGFTIDRVEKKDWPETYHDGEHGKMPFAPLVVAAITANAADVLTCSEW